MESTEDKKLQQSQQMSHAMINFATTNTKTKKVYTVPVRKNNFALEMIQLQSQNDAAEQELQAKKREFAERMEACAVKRVQLSKRRQEFDEYVASFKPIIEDSKVRRFKALQSAKAENKEITVKDRQIVELREELKSNREKIAEMQRKISEFKPLLTFMGQVKDGFRAGYLDDNVPVSEAIMKRYTTLKYLNESLKERNNDMIHMFTELQTDKVERKAKHESLVMKLTSEMASEKARLEKLVQENITREELLEKKMLEQQLKHQRLHTTLNAIESISSLCDDPSLPAPKPTKRRTMLDIKLRQIREFTIQKSLVLDYALKQLSKSTKRELTSIATPSLHTQESMGVASLQYE